MENAAVDRTEFERFYTRYRNRVHAYCLRRTGNDEAIDAVGETFLVAWRRISDIPGEPKTLAYLYSIARRVVANQRRSTVRRGRLNRKLGSIGEVSPPDPAVVVVRSAELAEVEHAIRSLKADDREMVMLDVWEELPRDEIAEVMEMSRGAVNQRLSRAYRRLSRQLGQRANVSVFPSITEKGGHG